MDKTLSKYRDKPTKVSPVTWLLRGPRATSGKPLNGPLKVERNGGEGGTLKLLSRHREVVAECFFVFLESLLQRASLDLTADSLRGEVVP